MPTFPPCTTRKQAAAKTPTPLAPDALPRESSIWRAWAVKTSKDAETSSSTDGLDIDTLERTLDAVDECEELTYRQVGILGRPIPRGYLEQLESEGRMGTSRQREMLSLYVMKRTSSSSSAATADGRDSFSASGRTLSASGGATKRGAGVGEKERTEVDQQTADAVKLMVAASAVRARETLAEFRAASEKVNASVRSSVSALDIVSLLLSPNTTTTTTTTTTTINSTGSNGYSYTASSSIPAGKVRDVEAVREAYADALQTMQEEPGRLTRNIDKAIRWFMEQPEVKTLRARRRLDKFKRDFSDWELRVKKEAIGRPKDTGGAYRTGITGPGEVWSTHKPSVYNLVGRRACVEGASDVVLRVVQRSVYDPVLGTDAVDKIFEELTEALNSESERETKEMARRMVMELSSAERFKHEQDDEEKRDRMMDTFLRELFPEAKPLGEVTSKTLRSKVFGKDGGGAFRARYVVDFDGVFSIFMGEPGSTDYGGQLSTEAALELLEERLKIFDLEGQVSLFLVRFPLLAFFDPRDVMVETFLDRPQHKVSRRNAQQNDLREGLRDMRRKVARGANAIIAVRTGVQPDPPSLIDNGGVRAVAAAGALVFQAAQALPHVLPAFDAKLKGAPAGELVKYTSGHLADVVGATLPIVLPFFALLLLHELGHLMASRTHRVPLGPPFPLALPFTGFLSTLKPFHSFPHTRHAQFDISAAGPLLGLLASYVLLSLGLWLTSIGLTSIGGAGAPQLSLKALQSSFLVSLVVDIFLPGLVSGGRTVASPDAILDVHPFMIAAIWGATVNALSLLPIGRLDGARMLEAFNRETCRLVSPIASAIAVVTGILLGRPELVVLTAVVSWLWPRRSLACRVESRDIGEERAIVGAVAMVVMLATLLPAWSL